MLSDIFYWVLNMSIVGSLIGLVVLAFRRIKTLPRFAVYILWTVPLIRLLIPFGIANKYSLLELISRFTTKNVPVSGKIPELTATNFVMSAESYFPIVYKSATLENIFTAASLVWLNVAVTAIAVTVILYLFSMSELKSAQLIRDNIYRSDKISTPAVYGIIHPKIIIPASLADGDIDYIVMHERVHIKRKDNFFRLIAVITACVHWFNPLCIIFLKAFFADMEFACDARVLKDLDKSREKDYAKAIVSCAAGKTIFASAFGGAKIIPRIEKILSYKRLTLLSTTMVCIFLVAIVIFLLTNAGI